LTCRFQYKIGASPDRPRYILGQFDGCIAQEWIYLTSFKLFRIELFWFELDTVGN
jgi:hypothetical protein